MPRTGPETKLRRKIKKGLEDEVGGEWWTVHGGPFQSGQPDLCGCVRGLYIAVEVKTDTGRTTPLQEATIRRIMEAGGLAFVARSPGYATTRVKRWLSKHGLENTKEKPSSKSTAKEVERYFLSKAAGKRSRR